MNGLRQFATVALLAGITQPLAGQEATTKLEDTGKELIIEVGPVDIPVPMEMAGHDHIGIFPPIGTVTVPTDGYLYGFDYEVVDAQGNELPSNIVHHFNIIDPDNRELFLPIHGGSWPRAARRAGNPCRGCCSECRSRAASGWW